jgi:hypothetical protein
MHEMLLKLLTGYHKLEVFFSALAKFLVQSMQH